jgi:hypothetical protein
MVRIHHRDEVAINVAGRLGRHVVHHLGHGGVVLLQERALLGAQGSLGSGRVRFMRECKRRHSECDENARGKERGAEAGLWPSASACKRRNDAAK